MISNTLKNLLLVAFSTVMTLIISIGAYELYNSHQYDKWVSKFKLEGDWYNKLTVPSENSVLLWEYRPNASGQKYGSIISTNSHGFRDREHNLAKEPDTRRIAFAGDSVTLGTGVDQEGTFVRLFEDIMHNDFPTIKVEALSFAVDGYNAIQVMEMISEHALQFKPDMIVYVMCMNDFDMQDSSGEKIKYFKKPDSFLLLRLERVYRNLFFEYHDYYFQKNQEQIYESIYQVKEALTAHGIEFRIVLMPVFPPGDSPVYPLTPLHNEVFGTLTGSSIPVIDLMESELTLGTTNPQKKYAQDIWHLNKLGHEVVARQLATELLEDITAITP